MDPRIESAIAHWGSRLIANGIDYNDFRATTGRLQSWDRWCVEWSRTAARHEALARQAEERGSRVSAAEANVRAALCYHFGKFVFFEDMDQYRAASASTAERYRRACEWLDPPAEAVDIPYAGALLPGYLRKPLGVERPPVAVIICGLDSVKEEMHTLEPLFHRRGMATLTFDGPGQGESEALPIEPAFEKVVSAILHWLGGRRDVDGARVGAAGVSLGGYYAARAAAFEPRLTCAAAIGGPYDFGAIWDELPGHTQNAVRLRSHAPDQETARGKAEELTLKDAAHRIEMPFLTIFGRQDRLIPPAQAERLHAEMPSSAKRLVMYEEGTHVCNNMPFAWRPLVSDWMAGHLDARPTVPG
ncbi:MAG TPA: alpha/beta hydrolase [Afifellaceae bacterium]|nr:alpha/beta hydrolase [Afifellaceae bacterium]